MSTKRRQPEGKEYQTEAERFIDTKPRKLVLSIHPQTEQAAREWLGPTHKLDCDKEVKEHFAEQVRRNL